MRISIAMLALLACVFFSILAWKTAHTRIGSLTSINRIRILTPFDYEDVGNTFNTFSAMGVNTKALSNMNNGLKSAATKYRNFTYLYSFLSLICAVYSLMKFIRILKEDQITSKV